MADRGRYDSAMFWLAFGTAAAVIGLALMTIGVSRSAAGASLFGSPWFDGGLALLVCGALLLLWSLLLFLSHRRSGTSSDGGSTGAPDSNMTEAIRGYYAERGKLFDIWDRQQKGRGRKRDG